MPKPMSLAQYRASVRVLGEKSALFQYEKEIFEALDMGLSHEQIHYFLTTQKGLKISRQALTSWLKKHKNTNQKATIFEPSQKQANTTVTQKNEVINQPKGEPATHLKVDDRASMAKAKLEAQAAEAGIDLSDLPQGLYSMFATQILK